jgi:uncharacterized protein YjbI with pentapeptide repeats
VANQEHLDLLNQGIWIWNQWRTEYPDIQPDLREASLKGVNLSKANFQNVDFREADLPGSDCSYCNLQGANLSFASMYGANFYSADLSYANLQRSDLFMTNLGANLYGVNLSWSDLGEADFSQSTMGLTILGDVDLHLAKGLERVTHQGPSIIGIDTIIRSRGKIPKIFLRNAGVPGSIIEAIPSLIDSLRPIDFYSCFIAYSSQDQPFANRLYADLQSNGVRCWIASEDMKIGAKFRPSIDESIHLCDKLLLVLSKHSVASNWVEHEVEMALAKEHREKRTVLLPVRLDTAILEREYDGWPALVQHERHIGDFTRWKDRDSYQQTFERLLRDLEAEPQRVKEEGI